MLDSVGHSGHDRRHCRNRRDGLAPASKAAPGDTGEHEDRDPDGGELDQIRGVDGVSRPGVARHAVNRGEDGPQEFRGCHGKTCTQRGDPGSQTNDAR